MNGEIAWEAPPVDWREARFAAVGCYFNRGNFTIRIYVPFTLLQDAGLRVGERVDVGRRWSVCIIRRARHKHVGFRVAPSGRRSGKAVITLAASRWLPRERQVFRPRELVRTRVGRGWLELELPEWARMEAR